MTTPTTVQVRMQLRADTAANWTSINPTLLSAEIGLERDTNKIKIGDGTTAWNSLGYFPFVVSGGVVTGNLEIGTTGTLTFEGSSADGFETTLAVVNPTADRTITLPNVTGTVITTGDTGTVTSTMIADGTIVNADVNASAAIAHSKLASMTAGFVLIGNASNVPTATALSGDVTVDSSGVTAIGSGVVVDADISATAEIAVSKLADGAARQLLQTDAAGTGVEWTDNVDVPGTLDVTGAATFDNNVTIQGDLTVNGTTTTVNSETLLVKDKNIEMGVVATPTDLTANGGGITLKGATDKTINWIDATDAWTSSEYLDLPAGAAGTPSLFFGSDVNSGLYSPGADQVAISTNGTGRLFVDASGRVLVNSANSYFTPVSAGTAPLFQLNSSSASAAQIAINSWSTGTDAGGTLALSRSDSGAVGTQAAVGSSDVLGNILFGGSDGTKFIGGAKISTSADGTWGTDSGPSKLTFLTTPTGSPTPTERLRITSTGTLNFVGAGTAGSSQAVSFSGSAPVNSLVVDSSGRLGIGTSAPTAILTTESSAAFSTTWDTFTGDGLRLSSLNATAGTNNYGAGISWSRNGNANTRAAGISSVQTGGDADEVGLAFFTHGSTDNTQPIVERARIDSSGRFLVGTPSARSTATLATGDQVFIEKAGNYAGLGLFANANSTLGSYIALGKSRGTTAGSVTVVQNNDVLGYIGFEGTDGTASRIAASIQTQVDGTPAGPTPGPSSMPGRLVFSTTANGASTPTERMRITSDGSVLIGETTNSQSARLALSSRTKTSANTCRLAVDCSSTIVGISSIANSTVARTHIEFENGAVVGSITTSGSATAYNTSSDYRLKENITPVTDGITRLQQLKPSRFNFIADPDKKVDGFIAHEVQTVVPEAITGEKDAVDSNGNPQYQGIDQSKLVPLLTAALQEAIGRIETLEAEVAALKAQ